MIQADVPQQAVSKHRHQHRLAFFWLLFFFLNRQGQTPQSAWDGAKVILDGDITALMFPHSSLHLVSTSQHRIPSQSGSSCRDIRPARCTSSLHPSAQRVRIINIYCTSPRPCRHKPASPNLVSYVAEVSAYPIPFFFSPLSLIVFLLHLLGDSILC